MEEWPSGYGAFVPPFCSERTVILTYFPGDSSKISYFVQLLKQTSILVEKSAW